MTRPAPGRLVLLGHPVAHSLSPAFQNAALRAAGIALRYEAIDVAPESLASCVAALRSVHSAGNITVPHKAAMFALCDRVTPLVVRVGAVNTFWEGDDGLLWGDNTDVAGVEALASSLGVRRDAAIVTCLGAGGAAAAVCAAVEGWPGASVRLVARGSERAQALAARFPEVVRCAALDDALPGSTVVINATPVGQHGDALPCDLARLPRDAYVMDLVYAPGETRWVRMARAAGHVAADGREMLLEQGAAAFRRWFGRAPDVAAMRAALAQAARD